MIYLELFWGFLKVGLFSFGGAYSAIPLIREVVQQYGWLDDEMLTYMIAVSESTPGSLMVNLATYVGSERAGILGAAAATLAVVLPAFAVILFFSAVIKNAQESKKNNLYTKCGKYAKVVLSGLMPCIIGIILSVGIHMLIKELSIGFGTGFTVDLTALFIAAGLSLIYFGSRRLFKDGITVGSRKFLKKGLSPIGLIVVSAILGVLVYGI